MAARGSRPPEADGLLAAGPQASALDAGAWRAPRRLRLASLLAAAGLLAGLGASSALRLRSLAAGSGLASAWEARAERGAPAVGLQEADVEWWEVLSEAAVDVYKWRSRAAPVLRQEWRCARLKGRRVGTEWLELASEPGFVRLGQDGSAVVRPVPSYRKLSNGTCGDVGMYPVRDAWTCEAAAAAMQLSDRELEPIALVPLPEGCHMFVGERSTGLYLSTNPLNTGNGFLRLREPICSSRDEPSGPCRPATTTLTTTTPAKAWPWPSLFCIAVASGRGRLLKEQLDRSAGVFACDEFAAYSLGAAELLGSWAGRDIYTKALQKGAGGQLSSASFMLLWREIKEDGRFRSHDWTVRVSPEAVFFPERLRQKLKAHTPAGGDRLFFQRCDRYAPEQSYDLMQVRSRAAVEAYFQSEESCKAALEWPGWSEEQFFQKCLEWIRVGSVFDPSLLQDASCGAVRCWDKSSVAYHDYHGRAGYWDCWRNAA